MCCSFYFRDNYDKTFFHSFLILINFAITKIIWGIFELSLTAYLESDMIVLIFSMGYPIIRLIGILVPLVNYNFILNFGISPLFLIGISALSSASVVVFCLEKLETYDKKAMMNKSRSFASLFVNVSMQ